MSLLKRLLRAWTPPIISKKLQHFRRHQIRFVGNFNTWEAAVSQCNGYDNKDILAKVLAASLQVKHQKVAFERDSVVFAEIEYSWPVTAALMWAAAQNHGSLRVLDFGGSLGSSYFQQRKFLPGLNEVKWGIVEQAHYVAAGQQYIADRHLNFYASIADCCIGTSPNVILLSSVLQYLPKPEDVLQHLMSLNCQTLIIDRTPFLNSNTNSTIKIQTVPATIYTASYPCWFFNKQHFLNLISAGGYELIESFDSLDKLSEQATWQGLIFKKQEQSNGI